MVWSHQDFEREVRRQMVEVVALRKRVPAIADLLQRLDLLEESQHYILRKLDQLFEAARPREEEMEGAGCCGADATSFLFGSHSHSSPRERSGRESGDGALSESESMADAVCAGSGKLSLLSQEAPTEVFPDIHDRCGICGELLISSLLAGGEVTYFESDWHHRDCLQGDPPQQNGALN